MRQRTLYFDVIQDTRFSENPNIDVNEWVQEILARLAKLPVTFKVDSMRKLHFSGDKGCDSYRQRIYVKKTSKTTWNTIYETINKTKPCVYQFA